MLQSSLSLGRSSEKDRYCHLSGGHGPDAEKVTRRHNCSIRAVSPTKFKIQGTKL
jgi:hypothetical protein